MREPLSLDSPIEEGSDTALVDTIAEERGPAADEAVTASSLRIAIARALACLREEDAHIVRLHFGLGAEGSFTADEIGTRLGISGTRVRQRVGRAIERLRHAEFGRELVAFVA